MTATRAAGRMRRVAPAILEVTLSPSAGPSPRRRNPAFIDNKHLADSDFWTQLVLFVSSDQALNKAHLRYLEASLIT
jgi:hypothetical protein